MKASLVHIVDPFRPHVGRTVHHITRTTRIDTLLRQSGLITGRGRNRRRRSNFIVANGPDSYLLEHEWSRCIADGEVVTFIAVPAGGGAFRVLATMAVLWAAAVIPGAQWGLALNGWQAATASALIGIGGSKLGTALLPKAVRR